MTQLSKYHLQEVEKLSLTMWIKGKDRLLIWQPKNYWLPMQQRIVLLNVLNIQITKTVFVIKCLPYTANLLFLMISSSHTSASIPS